MVPVWMGREPRTGKFHRNVSGTTSIPAGGKLYHQTSPHPRRWSKSAHTRSSHHLLGTDSQPVRSSESCCIVPAFSDSHWVLLRHTIFITVQVILHSYKVNIFSSWIDVYAWTCIFTEVNEHRIRENYIANKLACVQLLCQWWNEVWHGREVQY